MAPPTQTVQSLGREELSTITEMFEGVPNHLLFDDAIRSQVKTDNIKHYEFPINRFGQTVNIMIEEHLGSAPRVIEPDDLSKVTAAVGYYRGIVKNNLAKLDELFKSSSSATIQSAAYGPITLQRNAKNPNVPLYTILASHFAIAVQANGSIGSWSTHSANPQDPPSANPLPWKPIALTISDILNASSCSIQLGQLCIPKVRK